MKPSIEFGFRFPRWDKCFHFFPYTCWPDGFGYSVTVLWVSFAFAVVWDGTSRIVETDN